MRLNPAALRAPFLRPPAPPRYPGTSSGKPGEEVGTAHGVARDLDAGKGRLALRAAVEAMAKTEGNNRDYGREE